MDLRNLIGTHLDLPRLSKDLDETGPFGRLWSVRQWSAPHLARVWEAAKGFRPLTAEDLVPAATPPLGEVAHEGKTSLPFASHVDKRFCKGTDTNGEGAVFGYNVEPFRFAGPGYFVVRPGDDGELALDYATPPREKAPSWPALRPATRGLGSLVFAGVVDVLRGLSAHVSVGRVRKNGAYRDAWFALVRQEPVQAP